LFLPKLLRDDHLVLKQQLLITVCVYLVSYIIYKNYVVIFMIQQYLQYFNMMSPEYIPTIVRI
jgi:hypothetical protein